MTHPIHNPALNGPRAAKVNLRDTPFPEPSDVFRYRPDGWADE